MAQTGLEILAADAAPTAFQLESSAGIGLARELYPKLPYIREAFVPLPPWRPVSVPEIGAHGDGFDALPGRWLEWFQCPRDVYEAAASLRAMAADCASEDDLELLRKTAEFEASYQSASGWAATRVLTRTAIISDNLYFNSPGLPTTSNYGDDKLLGIHTDTLYDVSARERAYSPVRMCINLGLEPRWFLFINATVDELLFRLRETGAWTEPDARGAALRELRKAFMSSHPNEAVLRLRLLPGEGYIAPTENVIHDGSTEGTNSFDIIYMAHGHFMPCMPRG